LAKAVFKEVKLSLYSNLIEVGVNYCFVFWFINDDNKQTSIPSCVVEERWRAKTPSINTTLWLSISCKSIFFIRILNVIVLLWKNGKIIF
jgi:hypothetical protein